MAVRLFIGGLPLTMSAERLRQMFAAYRTVESATVPTVRDTTKSRPFAFVDMETLEGAEAAIRHRTTMADTEYQARRARHTDAIHGG